MNLWRRAALPLLRVCGSVFVADRLLLICHLIDDLIREELEDDGVRPARRS